MARDLTKILTQQTLQPGNMGAITITCHVRNIGQKFYAV